MFFDEDPRNKRRHGRSQGSPPRGASRIRPNRWNVRNGSEADTRGRENPAKATGDRFQPKADVSFNGHGGYRKQSVFTTAIWDIFLWRPWFPR